LIKVECVDVKGGKETKERKKEKEEGWTTTSYV